MDYNSELAGVSFSPDGMVIYVAFQDAAVWQFWREDGMPFDAPCADIHYSFDTGAVYDNENSLEFIVEDKAGEMIEEALEGSDEL
jgi:hypothetical protein